VPCLLDSAWVDGRQGEALTSATIGRHPAAPPPPSRCRPGPPSAALSLARDHLPTEDLSCNPRPHRQGCDGRLLALPNRIGASASGLAGKIGGKPSRRHASYVTLQGCPKPQCWMTSSSLAEPPCGISPRPQMIRLDWSTPLEKLANSPLTVTSSQSREWWNW
jgi:hypothetical protein